MRAANDNGLVAGGIRFRVEPRLVPKTKAARRLHLTPHEFDARLLRLIASGFPEPCPVIGHFDLVAIDRWLDRSSGLAAPAASYDPSVGFEDRLARLG